MQGKHHDLCTSEHVRTETQNDLSALGYDVGLQMLVAQTMRLARTSANLLAVHGMNVKVKCVTGWPNGDVLGLQDLESGGSEVTGLDISSGKTDLMCCLLVC